MNPFLLKAERKQQGWSQAKVAEALGITERTVRRWEQGLVVPYPYYRERLCALFGKTAEELGLPSEIDENEDIEEAPIPMTQPPEQDVLVEEKVKESLALELEGSISWRNGYKIPSLMKIMGVYSLPILETRHGRRRLLRLMLFLLVIMVMMSLAFLSSEPFILTIRKTPEVTKTPTSKAVTDNTETKVEPQVQNMCHGPDWQSHTDSSYGRYYTVKTNGNPFCYHASWTMPSGITAAKSCDFHVFSYPGSTATIRYYFSTYHRNTVYSDINQTTPNWSYFPRFMDVSFIELYVNDNQSGTAISVGPFLINNCQPY
ncbi:MAG TPA: helix-turn-helix transcriptional regulator [Ktedonobacteraceae bacterium]|nr:helix-turn-helix transcriptional regulator [Ktedonobacteraceae bacterium]